MGSCVCVHSSPHVVLTISMRRAVAPSKSAPTVAAAAAATVKIMIQIGCNVDKGDVMASSNTLILNRKPLYNINYESL